MKVWINNINGSGSMKDPRSLPSNYAYVTGNGKAVCQSCVAEHDEATPVQPDQGQRCDDCGGLL